MQFSPTLIKILLKMNDNEFIFKDTSIPFKTMMSYKIKSKM